MPGTDRCLNRGTPCSLTPQAVDLTGLSRVSAMGAGGGHSLALKGLDPAWSWGVNVAGQLGDGTADNRPAPAQVGALGFSNVAGGGNHSLALASDGTVRAWGANTNGQLGDGTTTNRAVPVVVGGLADVAAIAGGGSHSLALKSDGTVWAWGLNSAGQLGDGTTTQRTSPVQMQGLTDVIALAAGSSHSLALKSDGTVWSWGLNASGQLGDHSTKNSTTPVQANGLTGVTAIAAGSSHSLAVKNDGTVWAWGKNDVGQLGDGTTTQRLAPVQVQGVAGGGAIAAGTDHSLLLTKDGLLWAWGKNDVGQLGDCSTTNRRAPVRVCGLDGLAGTYEALHNSHASVGWTKADADPVNAVFGNFLYQQQDLALPGRGLPLLIARSYDSLDVANTGFGTGWSFAFNMSVTPVPQSSPAKVRVRYGDGRRDDFTSTDGTNYQPPAGIYNQLVKNADGTYTLTTPQQMVYAFDANGSLATARDRNGNTTTLSYATTGYANGTGGFTVTDPAGRAVQLSYGAAGTPDFYRYVKLVEVNGLGRTIQYAYDAQTGDLRYATDVRGKTWEYRYNAQHQLEQIVDPLGHTVVSNTYDGQNMVIRQRDGNGALAGCNPCATDITFTYDKAHRQTTVKDRRGNSTVYAYDASNRIVSDKDPLGNTERYEYDVANNRTAVTDRWNFTTRYEYNTAGSQPGSPGNLLTVTDPLNHATRYTYTARNDLKTVAVPVSDTESRTTTYEYDNNVAGGPGNLTAIVDPASGHTVFEYDTTAGRGGDVTKATDASGVVTAFHYDQNGNRDQLTRTPGDAGHTWQFQYDAGSRLKAVTDPLQHKTDYDYNAANQPTLVATHLGAEVTLSTTADYDAVGNLLYVQDANGHRTNFTVYDANNNLKTAVDAFTGHAVNYIYDENNNLKTAEDAFTAADGSRRKVTYTYDDANRLTAIADHAGHSVTYTDSPDPAGHVVDIQDANLATTRYTFDAAGRLTQVKDPAGQTTGYAYYQDNQLQQVTDADQHQTTYHYDAAGRPDRRTDQLGRIWSAVYDANGRIHSRSDPNGVTATYGYDGYDRLQTVAYSGGTPPTTTPSVAYAYDAANRRCWMASGTAPGDCASPPAGATTYAYDDADRLTGVAAPGTGTVGYQYDGTGRPTRVTYPSGHAVGYDYGTPDQVKVTDWQTPATPTVYGFDEAGRLTGITYPNGVTSAYGYDLAGRLNDVKHSQGAVTLARVQYTVLDGNGNRETVVETGTANAGTTEYAYDQLNRLTGALYPDGTEATWGYDHVGNRTTATTTPPGGATASMTYRYDATNRLCWAAPGTPTAPCASPPANATATYANDAAGNRTGKVEAGVTTAYGYDAENSLTSVTVSGTQTAAYTYDGDGYRVGKAAGGTATTYT